MSEVKKMRLPPIFWLILRPVLTAAAIGGIGIYAIAFYRVSSNNMFPHLKDGDLCICSRLAEPGSGDVVLYEDANGETRAGRIIAIPGQTIDFPQGQGYTVNSNMQYEEIPFETTLPDEKREAFPLALKEKEYFVMNDYRSDQKDSRTCGTLKRASIIGTVIFIVRGRGI